MGINLSFLPFIDACYKLDALCGPVYVLGSQEIQDQRNDVVNFAVKMKYKKLQEEVSVRNLFYDRYGIRSYTDCDLNDNADIKIDLNEPVPQEMSDSAMVVLDAGTIEHLLNLKQVLVNIHTIGKVGCTFIHITPVSWYNHAFVNFNPKLFYALMRENRYSLVVEAFHFSHRIIDGEVLKPELYITYDGNNYTLHADEMRERMFSHNLPAHVLYMIAYKKTCDDVFRIPYDI